MPDISMIKLGKKAARIDPRTLKLAKYLDFSKLSPVLPDVDYTGGVTSFGMMLNDTLGDCTIAGCGHGEQVWSIARGGEYTLPDAAILQKYEQWCGYDPTQTQPDGTNPTDQGGVEIDVLNLWRKGGIWKHPLTMYADPATTNVAHICKAIELFGGVYIGVQLPISVQGLNLWDVSSGPDAVPGSWGGHCVFVPKYRTENGKIIFTCISWGGLIDITEAFWLYNDPTIQDGSDVPNGPYIDEVHALVAPEFVSLKTGETPEGLDLAALEADVLLVTQ